MQGTQFYVLTSNESLPPGFTEALWVDVEANMESAMNAIDKSEYAFVGIEEGSMDGATHCYNTRKHDSRVSGVRLVAKKALGMPKRYFF